MVLIPKKVVFLYIFLLSFLISISFIACGEQSKGPDSSREFLIFSDKLTSGFDIGVNCSSGYSGWLEDTGEGMKMSYPSGEEWGAVFIVAGSVTDPPRPSENFSEFKTLSFEIKGENGEEAVQVGLKDKDDPDDGTETKITVCSLTTEWQTITIPLSKFTTADLGTLYVVIEFVFEGPDAQTVFFKNVKYLPHELEESGTCEISEEELPIYVGAELSEGYDIGVNSSTGLTNWLLDLNGYMKMEYPSNQTWGAVFITVGPPTDPPRPSQDLSSYTTLSVDLKGENGGEELEIGIKDNTDPDDGTETKIKILGLTTEWQTYTFSLLDFTTADLTRIYVVVEFVFSGPDAQTVFFRNVIYLID